MGQHGGGVNSDGIISQTLIGLNNELAQHVGADVLFLKAPMAQPIDDMVRHAVESIAGNGTDRLFVLVETTGGYIETVERIVRVFRRHYRTVEFVVPNYAYSAGTVLVLSGDEIHMDYFSVLGPIDPQYQEGEGNYVPGMGYLAKYDELLQEINSAADLAAVRAQVTYLVQKFEPAKLYHIEQAVEHSKSLLKDWLPRYKFKDWTVKESSGEPVTDADKERRANQIAECLGDPNEWHSHGRGIGIAELTSDKIKLKISNFGDDLDLNPKIRNYYNLCVDYMQKRGWSVAVHSKVGF